MAKICRLGNSLPIYSEQDRDLRETLAVAMGRGVIDFRYINFKGADLRGAHFNGMDLTGADLSYANLQGAQFTRAKMHNVDMTGAYAKDATLLGADLRGANLRHANLQGANLQNADLSWADIYNTEFGGTNLSNVTLYSGECRHFAQAVEHASIYKQAALIHSRFGWDIGISWPKKTASGYGYHTYRIRVESRDDAPYQY